MQSQGKLSRFVRRELYVHADVHVHVCVCVCVCVCMYVCVVCVCVCVHVRVRVRVCVLHAHDLLLECVRCVGKCDKQHAYTYVYDATTKEEATGHS